MRLTISDVVRQLRTEGLIVSADEDAMRDALRTADAGDVPWYVHVAAGFGAWIATLLLVFFIAIADIFDNEQGALILGSVFVVAAVILRQRTTGEFLKQLALAVSLTGQALVLYGIHGLSDSELMTALAAVLMSIVLVVIVPDRLHRFLSLLAGSTAAVIVAGELRISHGFEGVVLLVVALTAYVWRIALPRAASARRELLTPVGYGLVIALFGMLLVGSASGIAARSGSAADMAIWRLGALATIGITIALVLLLLAILRDQGTDPGSPPALVSVVPVLLLGALTLASPGIVAGAAVLALGFDRRNTILVGLAVLFLLVFGSAYYYSLNLTLLEKSGVLVASGVLLLIVRVFIARGIPARAQT